MFVQKSNLLKFTRTNTLLNATTGFIGKTVAACYPAALIQYFESLAIAYAEMENMLELAGFGMLTVIPRGTVQEVNFDLALNNQLGTHVLTEDPKIPWFGHSSFRNTYTVNLCTHLMSRCYKFGDAETQPIYFSVDILAMGHSNSDRAYTRPFVVVNFYETEMFVSPLFTWQSCQLGNYDTVNPGSGMRNAGFTFAANGSNLFVSFLNQPEVAMNNSDRACLGYAYSAVFSEGITQPLIFSKARAHGLDIDKEYVAAVHTSPLWQNTASSNAEDAIVPSVLYIPTSQYLYGREKLITPFGIETRLAGIGVPRGSISDHNAVRINRPFFMNYFYVDSLGSVYEFDGLIWGSILNRLSVAPYLGNASVNGEVRQLYQIPCIGPFTYETNNELWVTRANTLGLTADE